MMLRLVLMAGAIATLLLGCGVPGASSTSVQRAGGSIMVAASTEPEDVMEALVVGELTRTPMGCLALESGSDTHILQFPFGTTLADDGRSVEVPGLGAVELGDSIKGGGGYIKLPDVPRECRTDDDYAVWQTVNE
ncbi:hypothetical protein [Agromyces sp. NPDC058126]|uniref:hypothetical protein n=1 Tax=Agromyces sp. NPDC058126 TaxID=3346350 RepID=UPI0036DDE9B4